MNIESTSMYIVRLLSPLMLLVLLSQGAFAQNEQKGKELFAKLNCAECHSVNGMGGCLGPALDGVMKRRDAVYVRMRLNKDDESSFIKLIGHPELMPHPRFTKLEVANLICFLKTLPERKMEIAHHSAIPAAGNAAPARPAPDANSIAAGKKLFCESACLSCHSVGGTGGNIGPALDSVAQRRSAQEIEDFVANPRAAAKASKVMPQIKLSDLQRRQIVDFLLSLSNKK